MKKLLSAATIALAAGCAGSGGAEGGNLVTTSIAVEPPPIYSLLGYRTELRLSSEQIDALDSIARYVQQEYRPLLQELRDGSRERPRQPGLLDVNAETMEAFEEIRDLQQEAASAVQEVLTEEQQDAVCTLYHRSGTDRAWLTAGDRQPPADATGGSGHVTDGGSVWPWCAVIPDAPE